MSIQQRLFTDTHTSCQISASVKINHSLAFQSYWSTNAESQKNYACTVDLHLVYIPTIQLLIAYSIKTDEQELYIGRPQKQAIDLIQLTEEGRSAAFIIRQISDSRYLPSELVQSTKLAQSHYHGNKLQLYDNSGYIYNYGSQLPYSNSQRYQYWTPPPCGRCMNLFVPLVISGF